MPRPRLLLLLALLVFSVAKPPARAEDLAAARATLSASYSAQLDELAAWCQQHDQALGAQTLKGWLPERSTDQQVLFMLGRGDSSSDEKPDDKTATDSAEAEWRSRWQALRSAQAEALVALARRAVKEKQASLAIELVTEAVRENPDHAEARRILGYSRFRDAWHTPFEIKQLTAGKEWTDEFGWLPKAHVARYRKGERYYRGRWVTPQEDAALRTDVEHGWRVETEHYTVTTNHSLEEGVRLARRLERLHAVWRQMFYPFVVDDGELAKRFAGRNARRDPPQHKVIYYRNRQEYNQALRGYEPKIDISLGIYFATARTAFFFAGEDQQSGTVYHEATHQLFHESRKAAADVGRAANFWILEGVACYMESLDDRDAWCALGGSNAGRVPAARHRLLVDNFYAPLAELVTIGMESWLHDARLVPLYSQSAGLTDFLMHDQHGRYREALVRYLSAIYSGRATPQSLAELSGASYETLDRQYREFMSAGVQAETAASAR